MYKIFLYLILAMFSLSSCQNALEREKIYRADYYKYSCPQLYQKYNWIKQNYEQERASRIALNAASGMIEILDPGKPRRYNTHNPSSSKEYDYELQLRAIENVAIDKHCEGVSF